jgi:hypothetical protein
VSLRVWKALPAGLFVVLACCVNPNSIHDDFTARWIGKPIDDFTIRYGIASASQKLKDGRTVVEWSEGYGVANTGSPLVGAAAAIGGAETQGGSVQLRCQLRFVVDTTGRIEQIVIVKDTIGRWVNSRCAEVLTK